MPRRGGRPSKQYLEDTKRMQEKRKLREVGMLTGGQAKIAAKAPPTNKIDEKDFAVLREEKKGKPMKAALGAIALGIGGKKMMDKNKMSMPAGIGAASLLAKKKKNILGRKRGGVFEGYSKVFDTAVKAGEKASGTSTIVGVKPKAKKTKKTYKSMAEMREAKGFKPNESAKDFNKRQMLKKEALKAAKSTRLGKILLPIAAAGVATQQYLKSKMKKKKEEPKKKMGGGMMQKPMGYRSGKSIKVKDMPKPLLKTNKFKDMGKFPFVKGIGKKDISKKMGGGMMKRYSKGGDAAKSELAEQARRMGQRKPKPGSLGRGKTAGPRAGLGNLPGKKEEPYMILKTSVSEGPAKRYKTTKDFYITKDQIKGTNIDISNKSVGGSVTVKTKLGKNKPTKMY